MKNVMPILEGIRPHSNDEKGFQNRQRFFVVFLSKTTPIQLPELLNSNHDGNCQCDIVLDQRFYSIELRS